MEFVWILCVCGPFKEDRPVFSAWSSLEKAELAKDRSGEEFKLEIRHLVSWSITKTTIDKQEPM